MNRILLLTLIIFFAHSLLYADVVVYLKSTILAKEIVTVDDIAIVDGDEAEAVKKVNITNDALKDGYITRNEVYQSLKNVVSGLAIVNGSAVKLVKPEVFLIPDSSSKELSPILNELIVAKGDVVTVRLIKKSIVIEMTGKALQSGKTGDEIKISLFNGKTVIGKIGNNSIECYL
ncbi:MAG: flagella basal body P-ring formation protein FlgA [Spirochaetes bacterium]|nr:flagella basal body P-ring formation protein FlgA [Spirochaetota bacterium]